MVLSGCCVVVSDIKPSAVHVGNIVQGARMAWAQGRDLGLSDDDTDSKKVSSLQIFHLLTVQIFDEYEDSWHVVS